MVRFYFGKVVSIDKKYVIEFDILGQDSFDTKPTAYVLGEITNEVRPDDTVMIINVAYPMASFFYIPLRVSIDGDWENKLGIFNGDNSVYIDITDPQNIKIALNDLVAETNGDGKGIDLKLNDIELSTTSTTVDLSVGTNFKLNTTAANMTVTMGGLEIKGTPGTADIGGSGLLTMGGTAIPTGIGYLNTIPVCPMSGAIHCSNMVQL